MNKPTQLISAVMLALAAAGSAWAQAATDEHAAHHPAVAGAASAPAPAAQASMPGGMHDMKAMHEKHQKEMKQIHGSKSAAKRQKLMDKHMKEMHEHMDKNGSMDKAGGMGMMGQGMGASAPASKPH
jgi:Skp family chaperone for outer membrane proteins